MCSSPITEVYNPKTFFLHAASLGQAFAHCPIFPTAASRRSLDRISVPMWPFDLSVRLLIADLVSLYLTNYLIRREPIFHQVSLLVYKTCDSYTSCGISDRFQSLSRFERQVAHALLTRPPLGIAAPFDLNVLCTPPAFILSQDQTLEQIVYQPSPVNIKCVELVALFTF